MEIGSGNNSDSVAKIRLNKPPTTIERDAVRAHIESSSGLVASLVRELDLRLIKVADVSTLADAQGDLLHQAQGEWNAAISLREAISEIPTSIQTSLAKLDTVRGTVGQTTAIQAIGTAFADECHKTLTSVSDVMKHAEKAYNEAYERHQATLVRLDLARKAVFEVEGFISSIEERNTLETNILRMRSMWKLPREIWSYIFLEVTLPDRDRPFDALMRPAGWIHGSRAMLLSTVCQEWRSIVIGTKTMWNTINIDAAALREPALGKFINLHIERMGSAPCHLVINAEMHTIPQDGPDEWAGVLTKIEKLNHVHVYLNSFANTYVTEICQYLKSPLAITLEGRNPFEIPCVELPFSFTLLVKRLFILFTYISEPIASPLTHIHVHHDDATPVVDINHWAQQSLGSLESAVLLHRGRDSAVLENRIPLRRLRYLKTHLAFLINRIHSIYFVPNLRELVLASADGNFSRSWNTVALELSMEARLEKITICSMESHQAETCVSSLVLLGSVTTLEVRGESSEPVLARLSRHMVNLPNGGISKLKCVLVSDYSGDGTAILASAQSMAGVYSLSECRVEVEMESCPNVLNPVLRALSELFQGVPN